eukprot:3899357-Pyramimonas_sp.AAC.1
MLLRCLFLVATGSILVIACQASVPELTDSMTSLNCCESQPGTFHIRRFGVGSAQTLCQSGLRGSTVPL